MKSEKQAFSIGIRIKDSRYALALSERLTELSEGLEIVILKPGDTREVTVLIDDDVLTGIYSASELFEWIMDRAEECNAGLHHRRNKRKIKIWNFYSPTGGAGTTAVAFTAGRYLSAKFSEKCLYVDACGTEDFRIYMDSVKDKKGSQEELFYRICEGKCRNLERFLFQDSSGLYAASVSQEYERFVTTALNESEIEMLLLDWGKRTSVPELNCVNAESISFAVADSRDLRSRISDSMTGECDLYISNFSDYLSVSRNRAELAYCPDAFIRRDSRIEIRMDSAFSVNVGRIVEEVLGDER